MAKPFTNEAVNAAFNVAEAAIEFARLFDHVPVDSEVRAKFKYKKDGTSVYEVSVYDSEDLEYINRIWVNV